MEGEEELEYVMGGGGGWREQMLSVKGLSFTDVVCCSSAQEVIWFVSRGGGEGGGGAGTGVVLLLPSLCTKVWAMDRTAPSRPHPGQLAYN